MSSPRDSAVLSLSNEDDAPDDILSDADAVASLDGGLFSDDEASAAPAATLQPAKGWKVDHSSGNYRYKPRRFIEKVLDPLFEPADAIRMLHSKNTIDFGSSRAEGTAASANDDFFPSFYLDFLSIVGSPGVAISRRDGAIFDNVTVSFSNWAEPYGAKHVGGIQFDLTGRTFRIAEAATREKWFIVMHPRMSVATELPNDSSKGSRRRQRDDFTAARSGLPAVLARELATYITDIFQEPELVGEGVESCWRPGSRHSQRMSSDRWAAFQELFMGGWNAWVSSHHSEPTSFWRQHVPAFHAYDYGANIEIKVHQRLYTLPRERHAPRDDDSDVESDSDVEDDSDDGSVDATVFSSPPSSQMPPRQAGSVSTVEPASTAFAYYDEMLRESEGLQKLDKELTLRFNINGIAAISYALAVCINSGIQAPDSDEFTPRCLLIDRGQMALEYSHVRDYSFYSQAFSPVYGNVSSQSPPAFLHSLVSAMQSNLSMRHDGADALSFGYFQGYSNIKRNVRHSPRDLLATKGHATAALTVPTKEAKVAQVTARKMERALRLIRGQQTADAPDESKPFARERRQIDAAIDASEVAYRLEQVVSINTGNLRQEERSFETVLRPIFQLMRFFLREHESYVHIFRSLPLDVFPGIMSAYSRLFELALEEMDRRYVEGGEKGLDVAHSEGVAVLDRLGGYLFTGFDRHLPTSVLRPLGTIDGLRRGAWPYIDPEVLDLCALGRGGAILNMERWPRHPETQRPILLHVAELRYHYGERVATSRESELWFQQLGDEAFSRPHAAEALVAEVVGKLWRTQTKAFMQRQLRRRLTRADVGQDNELRRLVTGEALAACEAVIAAWAESDKAFTWSALERLLDGLSSSRATVDALTPRTRYDFARDLFQAASSGKGWQPLAAKEATWIQVLHMAVGRWHKTIDSTSPVRTEDWISILTKSLLDYDIEWVPGSSGGRVTSASVVRLRGHNSGGGPETCRLEPAGPVGSLRREAQEAEVRHELAVRMRAEQALERKTRRIHLGCPMPIAVIPPLIAEGFRKARTLFEKGDTRVLDHYHTAMSCLAVHIEDPLCHLMLMLVLTLCSSTETPFVAPNTHHFNPLPKRKDPPQVALALATRMMWYLYPVSFPWVKGAKTGAYDVGTMATKLAAVDGGLFAKLKDLKSAMKQPTRFIALVFGTDDAAWVERCQSIIRDV